MRTAARLLVALALLLLGGQAGAAERPVRVAVHDWTGQRITAALAGRLIEAAGHRVAYVAVDYLDALPAIARGEVDVATEQWDSTAHEAMAKAETDGTAVRLGTLGPRARDDWWYPAYMEARCPGLPDWRALRGCAGAFATPETAPNGRFLGLARLWGGHDAERIAALGLPFAVVDPDDEQAMYAMLRTAYARSEPILLWVYSPHWVGARFAGGRVAFPPHAPACETDPAWGVNPAATHDCGKPEGEIWKWAAPDFARDRPRAHRALARMRLDTATLEEMVAAVDLEGRSPEAVAAEWIAANRATWDAWLAE